MNIIKSPQPAATGSSFRPSQSRPTVMVAIVSDEQNDKTSSMWVEFDGSKQQYTEIKRSEEQKPESLNFSSVLLLAD